MIKLLAIAALACLALGTAACATDAAVEPAEPEVAAGDTMRCGFAGTGATLAFDGDRLNFMCETEEAEVGLVGDVEMTEDGWAMEAVTIGHGDEGAFVESSEVVMVDYIELDDGTMCASAGTGATAGYEDKRLNYTCDTEEDSGLFGDIVPADEGWTVDHAYFTMTHDGLEVSRSEMALIAALHVRGE